MAILKKFFPGLRIIKTFVALLLCLVLFNIIDYGYPVHAAVACVLMMKATPEETLEMGKYRVMGTLLGALVSFAAVLLVRALGIDYESLGMAFVISLSVLFSFIISKGFSLDTSVASMSAIIIIIMLMSKEIGNGILLLNIGVRTIETLVGILIAFGINRYIIPSKGI